MIQIKEEAEAKAELMEGKERIKSRPAHWPSGTFPRPICICVNVFEYLYLCNCV